MNLETYRYLIPSNLRHSVGQRLIDSSSVVELNVIDIVKFILWHPFLPHLTKYTFSKYDCINRYVGGNWEAFSTEFENDPYYKTFSRYLTNPSESLICDNDSYFNDWNFINNGTDVNASEKKIKLFDLDFKRYLEIYEDIKMNGYREIGPYPHGVVGKSGEFYLMGGRHRLTFCKKLGIKTIKVKILLQHEECINRNF